MAWVKPLSPMTKAVGQVAGRVDGVVGQDQVGLAQLLQLLEETVGAGDKLFALDEDAVHVGDIVLDGMHLVPFCPRLGRVGFQVKCSRLARP